MEHYRWECRKTLFMGLSDGARIDSLRRANIGVISNEQSVIATQIDKNKWDGLLADLRKDLTSLGEPSMATEKFSRVYLIDDFTGSGTSLLRPDKDGVGYIGKLPKFAESLKKVTEDLGGVSPFVDDFEVSVHHLIGTEKVQDKINHTYEAAKEFLSERGLKSVQFTFGMLLQAGVEIDSTSEYPFTSLCRKYFDPVLDDKGEHDKQSGIKGKMFGYAACGLPVVLEHNTPNNSLPLLWADTTEQSGLSGMRPLFRRRERHTDMGSGHQ